MQTLTYRRPYQREAIQAVLDHLRKGVQNQLICLPTGTGKTVIAADLPTALSLKPYEQFFFLVHLDTMAKQAEEKFRKYNPSLLIEVEKAERQASSDADVVIASVQTLGRNGSNRIDKFDPRRVRIVCIDEAHHSAKRESQYGIILRYFHALKGDPTYDRSKIVIGITATPNRADNIGLESIFDKIVYEKPISEMIDGGWLTDIQCHRISTEHSIASVKIRAGDFATRQLEEAINTDARNRLIVRKYQELARGLPALAFTVDVEHSHDLAEVFNRAGIAAAAVTGKTPPKERDHIYAAHQAGEIQVISSCAVLSEGADFPWATVGLMARPWRSPTGYIQQAGRLFRPYPAPEDAAAHADSYRKRNAVIIDFVDNSGKHQLIQIPTLFGLRSGFDSKGKSISEAAKEVETLEAKQPFLGIRSCLSLDEVQSVVERVELFRPPIVSVEARKYSKYAWIEAGVDTYHLALPSKTMLIMHINTLGQREIWESTSGVRKLVAVHRDPAEAFLHADRLVPKEHEKLVKAKMKWHCAEPTMAQCQFLFNLDPGVQRKFPSGSALYDFAAAQYQAGNLTYSRGQISKLITARKMAEVSP